MKTKKAIIFTKIGVVCLLFVSPLFFLSCKKKPAETGAQAQNPAPSTPTAQVIKDTIYPLPYLPAYPGSYWNYAKTKGAAGAVSVSCAPQYVRDSIWNYSGTSLTDYKDYAMVPLYNNGPLRAYYLHKRYAPQTGELWQIVMDANKGSSCVTAYDNVWHSMIRRTVLYRDTSLTIGVVTFSPVIVMREFDTQGGGATAINCDEYFAKNVGLIRRDEYGYNTTVPNDSVGKHLDESKVISRMVITDYFINKK